MPHLSHTPSPRFFLMAPATPCPLSQRQQKFFFSYSAMPTSLHRSTLKPQQQVANNNLRLPTSEAKRVSLCHTFHTFIAWKLPQYLQRTHFPSFSNHCEVNIVSIYFWHSNIFLAWRPCSKLEMVRCCSGFRPCSGQVLDQKSQFMPFVPPELSQTPAIKQTVALG